MSWLALLLPCGGDPHGGDHGAHPGMSLLTALLTMVITPIAMLVLSVTVVGPFVLGIVLFFLGIFGKVVFLGPGSGDASRNRLEVSGPGPLIGYVITLGIYLVPILASSSRS